jgi:hypothetical protein
MTRLALTGAGPAGGGGTAATPVESETIATNAGDSGSTNFNDVILDFANEQIDTHDVHAANGPFIVPATLNGLYAVFHAMLYITSVTGSSDFRAYITSTGSQQVGLPLMSAQLGSALTAIEVSLNSAPMLLTTGDQYEVKLAVSDTTTVLSSLSSFDMVTVG